MIAWLTDHPFIRKYGRGMIALILLSVLLGGLQFSYFTLAGETIPIAVVAKERLLKRYRTSKQETVEENGKTVKRSRRVTEYRYRYRVTIETGEKLWVEGPKRGDWLPLETPFDRLKVGNRYRVLVAPKWRWFRRSIHRIEAELPTTQKPTGSSSPSPKLDGNLRTGS